MKTTKPILTGILIAMFLLPLPAQAQWTVFDPTANVNAIKQLQQWMQAIQKYEAMIQHHIEQVTNLQGILKEAEKMGKWQKEISSWGKVIRLGFQLKWQVANLLTAQGRIFMGIQRRALNGILNPEQDLAEFERTGRWPDETSE